MNALNAVLILIAVSALAGLATALLRLWWGVLAISGLIIAIGAAAVLQNLGFEFIAGVAIIVGCLAINQFAYLLGAALVVFAWGDLEPSSTGDQPDEFPGESSQNDVAGEHEQHDEEPPRSHPPND